MKPIAFILLALAVIGLASWAYRENYRTHAALAEVDDLNTEIAHLRETLGVLRAEWAYLNRPDRLRHLADMNFDRLGLLPLTPGHFGLIMQVSEPLETAPVVEGIVLRGALATEAAE